MPETLRFIQGNEACAEGAIAAGARFFAGYPITPSSEIAEILARRLPQVGGKFIQMEDEIAAMGAVIGASLAGAKALAAAPCLIGTISAGCGACRIRRRGELRTLRPLQERGIPEDPAVRGGESFRRRIGSGRELSR